MIEPILNKVNRNLEKISRELSRIANYMEGSDKKDLQIAELKEELEEAEEKLRNRPRY